MLDAYGYRWYRVGCLDYLLRRKEIWDIARTSLPSWILSPHWNSKICRKTPGAMIDSGLICRFG